jgi:multicomponent K+:H+ antiporter subunit E
MKKIKLFYFALLMTTWIILTCSLNPYQLLLGAASCLIVALFTHGLIPESANMFINFKAIPVLGWYAALLVADMVKTNVIIAGRLLKLQPSSEHESMTFQSSMDNPLAVTMLANTLSLIYDSAVVTMGARSGELLVQYAVMPNRDGGSLIRERINKYQALLGKLS